MMNLRTFAVEPYPIIYQEMLSFTEKRTEETKDELWFLQHQPVFTQGQAGKAEHILFPGNIPVIQTDRGGQVTYHGPGQLVVYLLLNIRRLGLGSRSLVECIERAIVSTLKEWDISAEARTDAPGVYVGDKKIASLGLRIKKGCTFHGLALNVDMDLEPFSRINPCGYAGMQMTQMVNETQQPVEFNQVLNRLKTYLIAELNQPRETHE